MLVTSFYRRHETAHVDYIHDVNFVSRGIGGMVSDYLHDKTLNRIGNAILMTVTITAMAGK